jgi:methanogenic corrinoid protein MtbC1
MAASRETQLSRHADAYLRALLARDAPAARALVDEALAGGASIVDVYVGVFQPALYAVGDAWACDRVSVAGEHVATAVTESIMGELSPRLRAEPRDGRLAVVACTPEERHCIGIRMVRDLLEADGWEVLELGACTPAGDLAQLVSEECPDAVALSTSTAGRLPGIEEMLRALDAVRPRPLIVVGGQFWTAEAAALAPELGADFVVRDARMLPPLLAKRVQRAQ